jgi:hypothetical protein
VSAICVGRIKYTTRPLDGTEMSVSCTENGMHLLRKRQLAAVPNEKWHASAFYVKDNFIISVPSNGRVVYFIRPTQIADTAVRGLKCLNVTCYLLI